MEVGIIGPAGAGKSTLFHSLTGVRAGLSGKIELTRGVAQVIDSRVDYIEKTYNSRKKVYPVVEYVDSPPIETGGFKKANFRQEFLRGMERTDALAMTIPVFLPGQKEKAVSAVRELLTEFALSDLEILEKRLERVERDVKRGVKELQKEGELLHKCQEALESEIQLSRIVFSEDEMKVLRSFSFLTIKPKLVVLNIAESDIPARKAVEEAVKSQLPEENIISICAKVQSEIRDLPEEEIPAFMQEMGIEESASNMVIKKTREILGLITFLTAGEQEAHGWDLRQGATASEAAGVIHSDLQRGFIRAEVFHFDDLVKYNNESELKAKGLIRLEGKDYVVKDGDILLIRFKV